MLPCGRGIEFGGGPLFGGPRGLLPKRFPVGGMFGFGGRQPGGGPLGGPRGLLPKRFPVGGIPGCGGRKPGGGPKRFPVGGIPFGGRPGGGPKPGRRIIYPPLRGTVFGRVIICYD